MDTEGKLVSGLIFVTTISIIWSKKKEVTFNLLTIYNSGEGFPKMTHFLLLSLEFDGNFLTAETELGGNHDEAYCAA